MNEDTRALLMERIQDGHPEGVSQLLDQVGDALTTYSRALCWRDQARFTMMMEDILVDILKHIGAVNDAPSLLAFSMKRACATVRRGHTWVFRESPERRSKEADITKLESLEEPSTLDLNDAMARLSPEERELLVLKHYLGFNVPEISDFTMRGAASIEEDLLNARQRFRHALIANQERYASRTRVEAL